MYKKRKRENDGREGCEKNLRARSTDVLRTTSETLHVEKKSQTERSKAGRCIESEDATRQDNALEYNLRVFKHFGQIRAQDSWIC